MEDREFIQAMLEKGNEAKQKVLSEFANLTLIQLNWKSSPESWSIGQCLDHLLVSNLQYFPILKKIAEGRYKMRFWERNSPFSRIFGHMIAEATQEKVKKKMKTPKVFHPSESQVDAGIIERFLKHLDTLMAYTAACSKEDLDMTRITSPVSKFITYSLRHTFQILYPHLHRHINQGLKVKSFMIA